MWHDTMGYMGGNGWGHMLFGGAMMLVFWGLVIALIVILIKHFAKQRPHARAISPDALDILRERYARGEIDRQEYEERHRDLSS
ncbi:SHOCT domain-containing protein [Halomonas sp. HP20-15]|uniref:SHOCT domain-containing protein n=1 Tax=Halomonas sp. HP20-15 TaxID=3085901 RepID=UPI0029810D20|nr:SHOCT domain-containing protein [Halomonas sp. HP20-15]MDW5376519.1 SHOCT domain-containing protein [Halomonas sp. HP20-15]